MDNELVKVNVPSIIDVGNQYNAHIKNILNTLSDILDSYNSLEEILSTNASKEYQNRVIKFLNKSIDNIEQNRINFGDRINEITNLYTELYSDIKDSIDKTNNMEG